ncbi:glycosyltransferase [Limibaculum sp. M0105]|uniref:Glycosyltransferase n=1 Tax=Thermohalobaculum xanthum TaxID=2753746 RepID=A0A8J7M703_9RHOB|nr:glycosyltransferase [Thermohalobaculum xanthum]MBK0399761.1 glycosyltransferase [Thermohalobaculum xanthum]
MSAPFFSVIIPSFNRLSFLQECIASVRAQTFQDFELIVVDDGSTDGTSDYLASEVPGVHPVRQANAGPGAARNKGASVACGRYLAFLDSDDLWTPWALETYARALARCDACSVIFGNFADFENVEQLAWGERAAFAIDHRACFLDACQEGYFAGAGMMVVERAVFEDITGFREKRMNAEDHDLALRLGDARGFVQVLSPITVFHRIHGSNETASLAQSYAGMRHLVGTELQGGYPGGRERAAQRRSIIGRHVRPVVLSAARSGQFLEAWALYKATAGWQAREMRFKFLAGAALIIGAAAVRRIAHG